jgi:crotonobetainyl-CoA:carnitine CoA-transferase CaiB-like acyl-CoA transferase
VKSKQKKETFLAGLQVLDLADEKASYCSKLLADLGARVIKVEKPGGDPSRKIGPFWNDSPHPERSLPFFYNNTNKLGITLNLGHCEGKKNFLRLVEESDVVVEAFPPRHLEGLGLGFEALSKINPGIILASVTGFGQNGPRKDYKSCDLVASAFGGQMYVSGSPSTFPLKIFGEQSYYIASLYAAIGILLALQNRRQSRRGEHLDVSLQEAVTSTLEHVMVQFFYEHIIPKRKEGLHWNNAFCILPCKDGFIHLTLFQQWETLVEWMARENKAGDLLATKWKDEEYRKTHLDHIVEALQGWTKDHTAGELFEMGQLMHFPWAPVQSPQEVLDSPHLKARGFFSEIDHPELNTTIKYPGLPYKFSSLPPIQYKRAPLIGQDNAQIVHKGQSVAVTEHKKVRAINKGRFIKKGFLKGLRVLDFTRVQAGPYATRIIADFGAEVIKVQSQKTAKGAESNSEGYFNTWNRNKKSITLDMSHVEARELALELAAISDVVIENFSPRVMSNWGLNYERMKEIKSDLIMISMSGMGQTGPWKDFVAFGPTIQSLGGLTYLTSYAKGPPIGLGYSYADTIAGLYGALAVLMALEYRDRTGQGQYIDLSEYEAICTINGPLFLDLSANQRTVLPEGNRSDSMPSAPHGCYKCAGKDRWCVIAVFNDAEWEGLCQVMGQPDWRKEERFSTLSKRKAQSEKVDELIGQWTSKNTPEKVVRLLQEAGVPSGIVQNSEDLANDPQLMARDFFVHLKHHVLGDTISDGSPIKFSRTPTGPWKAAPLLGEDNQYVYTQLLGLTEEELSSYIRKGIIA